MVLANSRDLFGLPRKFNVSFDGGGRVGVVCDTNDIGFVATRVGGDGDVGFRVLLAGITGHGRFAKDCGIVVAPDECVAVATAMLRVFAEHGDRTDRKKSRLRYALDRLGEAGFLGADCRRSSLFRCASSRRSGCRRARPPTSTATSACMRRGSRGSRRSGSRSRWDGSVRCRCTRSRASPTRSAAASCA